MTTYKKILLALGVIGVVVVVTVFIMAMVSDMRHISMEECHLRLRGAKSTADSIQVLNLHPFCSNAL